MGIGEIVEQVCRDCRGEVYTHVNKRLKVTVPAAVPTQLLVWSFAD